MTASLYPPLTPDRNQRSEFTLTQTLLYAQLTGEDGSLDYFIAEYDRSSDTAFGWVHDGGNARGEWRDFDLGPLLADDAWDIQIWGTPDTQETVAHWQHLGDHLDDDEY